jgi:DNA-binding protein HU-beta
LTKTSIVDELTQKSGLKKKEVIFIVDNFLEKIKESVAEGETVEIRGFGTFFLNDKKARKVFSPIANKKIDVPAKSLLGFKASKATEKEPKIKGA